MSDGGVGSTLTNGIQDISALLPLIGTEQCEKHIGSALERGYLYAAATPMSIFGALGLARAGLKTAIAGIHVSFGDSFTFCGATKLADMGFSGSGSTLPLIMSVEGEHSEKKYNHLAEARLDKLLKDLHIDPAGDIKITLNKEMKEWNIYMILYTAILCSLSVIPYIFLNTRSGVTLNVSARWTFPVLRAFGGFLTATMIQLVIQQRIVSIAQAWLKNRSTPGKETNKTNKTNKNISQPKTFYATWFYILLLTFGAVATIAGYVGCFSVVQSSQSTWGPLSWLGLELGLSAIRIVLWGSNPPGDDAPPLELFLTLGNEAPRPTCFYSENQIKEDKILPLVPAAEFCKSIAAYVGPIKHFDYSDLTVYYTLTREISDQERCGRRVLYITVVDYKQRATRIYKQEAAYSANTEVSERLYSSVDGVPIIDLPRHRFETIIGSEITDVDSDPVITLDVRHKLHMHYKSIVDLLHRRLSLAGYDSKINHDSETKVSHDSDEGMEQASRTNGTRSLLENYRSIIDPIRRWIDMTDHDSRGSVEDGDVKQDSKRNTKHSEPPVIECTWKLTHHDTEKKATSKGQVGKNTEEKLTRESGELDRFSTDYLYFQLGKHDKTLRDSLHPRHRWLKCYNEHIDASKDPKGENNRLIMAEKMMMEILDMWEREQWELLFLKETSSILEKAFPDDAPGARNPEKVNIWREARSSCLRRLELASMKCKERVKSFTRMNAIMQTAWELLIVRYRKDPQSLLSLQSTSDCRTVKNLVDDLKKSLQEWKFNKSSDFTSMHSIIDQMLSDSACTSKDKHWFKAIRTRFRNAKRDAECRIKELGFNAFPEHFTTPSETLVELRHWTRVWLCPDRIWNIASELADTDDSCDNIAAARRLFADFSLLDKVSFIYIGDLVAYPPEIVMGLIKAICDMPSVTSIMFGKPIPPTLSEDIYDCLRENKRLLSLSCTTPDVELKNIELKNIEKNDQTELEKTRETLMVVNATDVDVLGEGLGYWRLGNNTEIVLAFTGPSNNDLTLRISCPLKIDRGPEEKTSNVDPFVVQARVNNGPIKRIDIDTQASKTSNSGEDIYDVNLRCRKFADKLFFFPGERNRVTLTINIEPGQKCTLHRVELLKDEEHWNGQE